MAQGLAGVEHTLVRIRLHVGQLLLFPRERQRCPRRIVTWPTRGLRATNPHSLIVKCRASTLYLIRATGSSPFAPHIMKRSAML